MAATRQLFRSRTGRLLGGVCAGLARHFGVSVWLVRALAVLSCVLPGPQVLIYLGLWFFLPVED